MKIEINVDDLSKYLSDEELKEIVENKISEIIKKHYEDSLSKLVYDRIDGAISLLITEKILDDNLKKQLKERISDKIKTLESYYIFNYDYDSGRPKNEPARVLDSIFDNNLKSKLRRKLIKCANQKVKNVTRDEIMDWTIYGIDDAIHELFKQRKEN